MKTYPIAKPWITDAEIKRVEAVLRSGHLSLGPVATEFEKTFASYVGTKYAAAVSSGTAGLHLCIRLQNLQEGDEVITSPYSFVASANSILYERAIPKFVDIDPRTLNLDVRQIEKAITPRTKGILPVHIFGYPAEMDAIRVIADKHGLFIVEDACESLGATYKGKKLGALGYPAVFAFYANKQMTTAEGGIVTTDDESVYKKIKSFSNQGRGDGDLWLKHEVLGYNYRLSDVHSAIGLGQLERMDEALAKRDAIAQTYHRLLADVQELELLDASLPEKRSWFIYPAWTRKPLQRDALMQALNSLGVASRPYLPSIHLQPFYRQRFGYQEGAFPVSEDRSDRGLAFPFYIGLQEEDLKIISDRIKEAIAKLLKGGKIYA